MNDEPTYSIDEFERESRYIENLIWDALCIDKGERVLFCGFGPDGTRVKRAVDAGANVFVIEHRDDVIREFEEIGAQLLRGSTSVIPAKADAYDMAISFHYLHEVDPFFHAQVVSELARVGKRVAIVEPAPPADPLGRRIALLYSQAKRELGQFEYYQPMDYWKKLLQAVKVEISQSVFAFGKVPPREYLEDTIELILDTMEVEEVPRAYMEELRAIAKRPSAQLLPPARFVLMGASAGELPQPRHTQREAPKRPPSQLAIAAAFDKKRDIEPSPSPAPAVYSTQGVQPEYPPPPPPPPQSPAAQPLTPGAAEPQPAEPVTFGVPMQPQPQVPPPDATPGWGAPAPAAPGWGAPPTGAEPQPGWGSPPPGAPPEPAPEAAPFGMPFAMPQTPLPEQEAASGFGLPPAADRPTGWQWEPPEGGEENPPQ